MSGFRKLSSTSICRIIVRFVDDLVDEIGPVHAIRHFTSVEWDIL